MSVHPVSLSLTPSWSENDLILVRATDAVRLGRQSDYEVVPRGQAEAHLDDLARRDMMSIRVFCAKLGELRHSLPSLDRHELLCQIQGLIQRGELVALRAAESEPDDSRRARVEQRRLLRAIEAALGRWLRHAGRQYRLVTDVDIGRLPDRNNVEVVRHDEAAAVLDAVARRAGPVRSDLAPLLTKAKSRLSRDWRPPSSPDGLVLVRKAVTIASSPRDVEQAVTPSEMRKLMAKEWSLSNPRWKHEDKHRDGESPDAVLQGDEIALYADVQGAPEGTKVCFEILDETTDPPELLDTLYGPNKAGVAKVVWCARDLERSHVPKTELSASFTASLEDQRTQNCPIPYIPEMGQLHVMVRTLHLDRPFGNHAIVLSGQGIEVRGTLDEEGVFEHTEEVPFGEYRLSIGEFETKVLAVRDDDPPFVVPAPPEAIPEERWQLKDMESEGAEFA